MSGFGRFPRGSAKELRSATATACKVYLALAEFWSADWKAWPSRDKLARTTGLSATRVSEGLTELRGLGLIVEAGWKNRVKVHQIGEQLFADMSSLTDLSAEADMSARPDKSEGDLSAEADMSGEADLSALTDRHVRSDGSTCPLSRTHIRKTRSEQREGHTGQKKAARRKRSRMVAGFRGWGGVDPKIQKLATEKVCAAWDETGTLVKKAPGFFDSQSGLGRFVHELIDLGQTAELERPEMWDRLCAKALEIHRAKGDEPKWFPQKVLDLLDEWVRNIRNREQSLATAAERRAKDEDEARSQAALAERIQRARAGDLEEAEKLEREGVW